MPHERPGWLVRLRDFTRLDPVISLADIREQTPELRAIVESLEAQHGKPLYFPFELSETRPARPLQGYLFKLPAAFPLVFAGGGSPALPPSPTQIGGKKPQSKKGQGFMASAEHKAAVELRAMLLVANHFEGLGYTVVDTSPNNPFDFLAERGGERLYVEVKGTTGDGGTVFLTKNEVRHAQDNPTCSVLVVVSDIVLRQDVDGIQAVGGSISIHWPWSPLPADLVADRYTYRVPTDPCQ